MTPTPDTPNDDARFEERLRAAALTAAPFAASAEDEVIVGFAASYSGWMQAYSQPSTNAALIAIDDINANGGQLPILHQIGMIDDKS